MEKIIQLHRKIAPELIALIEERYNILKHIQYAQPVGRRALAVMLGMGERSVRAQVDFLKTAGLISFSSLGMTISSEGFAMLHDLADYVRAVRGLTELEIFLQQVLNVGKVVIVPGDCDADATVLQELGRAAATVLTDQLSEDMIVAVSGGSTMAVVAESVPAACPSVVVVPARGGLGENVEFQANTIAGVMAKKLGCRYRQLYIPDGVSEETLAVILQEDSQVKSVVELIKKADILIHGIGTVKQMARRRGLDDYIVEELVQHKAAGEALGQYCTIDGDIVYVTGSVGLLLDDVSTLGKVIAVAGGRLKAQAILAVTSAGKQGILVTDEGAAREIYRLSMIAISSRGSDDLLSQ